MMSDRRNLAFLLLLFLLAGAPAARAVYEPQPCKNNAFTFEKEIEQGQQSQEQIYREMPVLPDDAPVSRYVQELGAKLAAQAPGHTWPYEFHVVNQADINAFALPGGPIFVNLGTLQAAETEAQLAGAMAHEIAHVVERHATCNMTKARKQQLGYGIAGALAGIFLPGPYGALAQTGTGAVAGLTYLRMSRGSEEQADQLGTVILYDAGYDPRGLPQFFEIIESKYGKGGAQWLSDHPNPGNRTEAVNREIAGLPRREHPTKSSPAFAAMQEQVKDLKPLTAKEIAQGEWRKQGSLPAPAGDAVDFSASQRWKRLEDIGFSLEYPENWQVFDGPGAATSIAPVKGMQGTGGALLYGLIVDSYKPAAQSDLASAANQLLGTLQAANPGLQPAGSFADVQVGGKAARSLEGINAKAAPGGTPERDWIVAVGRRDGSLTSIIFVAPDKDFAALRPVFERVLSSFLLRE